MFRNSFRILAGAAVCLTLTLLAMQPAATAQPPDPVIRTFALAGLAGQSTADLPDFFSQSSKSVTVLPGGSGAGAIVLSNLSPALGGTVWQFKSAHHATQGNDSAGAFLWLQTEEAPDVPTVGAHTFTGDGPNSLVFEVELFYIRLCTASDIVAGRCESGEAGTHWTVTSDTSAQAIAVVTALFSK